MTKAETKTHSTDSVQVCQNCKKDFVIEPDDFAFYEKMKVPAPTWCSDCRRMRRFAFTNLWYLYRRPCAKCGKDVISIYSPDKKFLVYCAPCWWADDWDGTEYAADYDASKPFLEQVRDLNLKTPRQGLEYSYLSNTNCDYANGVAHCKNCYLVFWSDYCENAYYSTFINSLKDSLDCYRMIDGELCYGDIGCKKCYRTFFSEECDSCTDIWFSRSCAGCTNCFGCINLRNKSYCIFNEQYSREEYLGKLKDFSLNSRTALAEIEKRVHEFWSKHPYRAYIGNSLNVNVTGDYIYESKNTKDAYMVTNTEDSRFVEFVSVASTRDAYDYAGWGNGAERIYESATVGEGASDVKFSLMCWPDALDNEYSMYSVSCKHVFGCANLKRKQYCILNKEYSKEEYEKLSAQIREDMKKNPYVDLTGRKWPYGEFLPLEFSTFAYNETLAQQFFPKTKEEVLALGMSWYEGEGNKHVITKNGDKLPNTITETDESVLKEAIGCVECGKAFKIVFGELELMRKLNLPLPGACPSCREKARLARTNLPRLYDRKCAKCGKEIKTSYASDRPEIVYCESCYQSEVS